MQLYTIEKISEILEDELILTHLKKTNYIDNIVTDSRNFVSSHNSIFFALIGQNHDGHNYISDLYNSGVRNFVISKILDFSNFMDTNFILVKNSLSALQKIAKFHRQNFKIPILAITGSNGKTIVKEWISQLLNPYVPLLKSPKSYNSQLGVPLSVWNLNQNYELAIFEAGISQTNEMERLEQIINPTIGIITNIGDAHQENFVSINQKVEEKLKLFKNVQTIIYSKDYVEIHEQIISNPFFENKEIISWSFSQKADYMITKILITNFNSEIEISNNSVCETITIPFKDKAAIENAIFSYIFIKRFYANFKINFQDLEPIAMRLELKNGINNCTLINDSYNCDIASLKIALELINQQNQNTKKTLILSDIQEVSNDNEFTYRTVSQIIKSAKIDKIIGIGENISLYEKMFECNKKFYKTTKDFLIDFQNNTFQNETILLKGARKFTFEKITKTLQEKAHQTILEINLGALTHNLNYFRALLKPETKIMVMVKAFSYGSGTYEIANLLQHQRVDYLGVAITDEGIELRKKGITLPIIVMNPEKDSFYKLIEYNLEPEIYDFNVLHNFVKTVNKYSPLSYPIHLKLDTGMNRLGFKPEEIENLILELKSYKKILVKSIFSHLAGSSEEVFDEFTNEQINMFQNISQNIINQLNYPIIRHILNSAGIERFTNSQYEMVRLGIGLYGISALPENKLMNISTLKTTILQIKNLNQGETVGYSRVGKITKPSQIAIIPIGYADGLNRKLSNGVGEVLVNGCKCKIIGNICMDMCMLDVTNVNAKQGDDVIIFGDKIPISKIAQLNQTIPYEILTSISQRVKRVYFKE